MQHLFIYIGESVQSYNQKKTATAFLTQYGNFDLYIPDSIKALIYESYLEINYDIIIKTKKS